MIAIATEFSVLLSARYEEERAPGVPFGEALRRAYSRTGMAVLASGITAIAGFAALIATDIRMLRDFGLVTVLDLGVALLGVLLVLPAALAVGGDRVRALRVAVQARHPRQAGARPGMSEEDGGAPDQRRKPGSRYSIYVGIAFVILIVIATVNTLSTRDDGILGTSATERGEPLPQFAVPELLGSQEGDANIFQDDCATGSNPCPTDDRAPRPARSTSPR